ncbi:patatin-like phospholipase family protein [Dyadobacter sp. 32]|uniref:patatin-like phospholipase family protein n=1 Tax=Dyadobacter sp. 32 TaxID=538966 RepID=UPI0011EEF19A
MRALVLGGGSMKGAFQVGVIQAVLENGFQPEMIYGISVGALNSTFLTHEAGRQQQDSGQVRWELASRKLLEFWVKNITHPYDISTLRSRVSLGVSTLMSRFEGLLDTTPLHNLISRNIDINLLREATIKLKVGTVNIESGEMKYVTPDNKHFLDYVRASSSIPMLMPAIEIDDDLYLDGSLREVLPIRQAIEDGATEIVLIACHSPHLYQPEGINARNLITLIERIRDITINEVANSNIIWAESAVDRAILRGKEMKLTVIRPASPLILDLQHFTPEDISRLIVEGYKTGMETLRKAEMVG